MTCGIFAGFSMAQPKDSPLRRFVLLLGALAAALVGYSAFRGGKIVHGDPPTAAASTLIDREAT